MKTALLALVIILSPLSVSAASLSASKVHTLVNQERTAQHLNPIKRTSALDAVAQAKLNDMLKYNYFSHTSPTGKKFSYWFQVKNYIYTYGGENLARYFTTEKAMVKAWMGSPSHRANILKPQYTDTGIAVSGSLVVQEFAKPFK